VSTSPLNRIDHQAKDKAAQDACANLVSKHPDTPLFVFDRYGA